MKHYSKKDLSKLKRFLKNVFKLRNLDLFENIKNLNEINHQRKLPYITKTEMPQKKLKNVIVKKTIHAGQIQIVSIDHFSSNAG